MHEHEKAIDLTIHTKSPNKWILIDLETGQYYRGQTELSAYGKWKRIKDKPSKLFIWVHFIRFRLKKW